MRVCNTCVDARKQLIMLAFVENGVREPEPALFEPTFRLLPSLVLR